jgi:hypothetical protein
MKEPSRFRLPPIDQPHIDITSIPLLLIGPGTGLAPFISFIQKIRYFMPCKIKASDCNYSLIFSWFIEKMDTKSAATRRHPCIPRYLLYGSSCLADEYLFKYYFS